VAIRSILKYLTAGYRRKKMKKSNVLILLVIFNLLILFTDVLVEAKASNKEFEISIENKEIISSKSVKINVSLFKQSDIKIVKWAAGKKSKNYFLKKGNKIKFISGEGSFKVSNNDIYTVYVLNKEKEATIKMIKVNNIDKDAPRINYSTDLSITDYGIIKLDLYDKNGVQNVSYVEGKINSTSDLCWENATTIDHNTFEVYNNGFYTVKVTDTVGNSRLKIISIKHILQTSLDTDYLPNSNIDIYDYYGSYTLKINSISNIINVMDSSDFNAYLVSYTYTNNTFKSALNGLYISSSDFKAYDSNGVELNTSDFAISNITFDELTTLPELASVGEKVNASFVVFTNKDLKELEYYFYNRQVKEVAVKIKL
jgi:hypothetical protein